MLRKIRLYGELAKFLGHRVLEADVATAAEAVRFLLANWPELEQHMADGHYRVQVDKEDLPLDAEPERLHYPAGKSDIRIIPVIVGAGAVGRIIAGVALVALSFAIPGAALSLALAGYYGAGSALLTAGSIAFTVGVSLALGGVAQLLTPTPKTNRDDTDPRKSFSFSGIQNTSREGTPVPIGLGETIKGSVVISAAINIDQVVV
jgi:predicted phage tail protein